MKRNSILAGCAALLFAAVAHAAEPPVDVRAIQRELAAHGYSPGEPDGRLDARTEGAIRDYQRDAGLPADGAPSRALLEHLRSPQTRVHAKGLQMRQSDVPQDVIIRAQQLLKSRGY